MHLLLVVSSYIKMVDRIILGSWSFSDKRVDKYPGSQLEILNIGRKMRSLARRNGTFSNNELMIY